MPNDAIKIDRSFIRGIDSDRHDAALTHNVIELANCMGLRTIAEGVEVAAKAGMLLACRCEDAHGFLFHRNMAKNDYVVLLSPGTDDDALEGKEVQLWLH